MQEPQLETHSDHWIAKYHFKAMHVISFGFCIIYSQNVVKKGLFCMCVH